MKRLIEKVRTKKTLEAVSFVYRLIILAVLLAFGETTSIFVWASETARVVLEAIRSQSTKLSGQSNTAAASEAQRK